jgi:transposase
MSQFDVGWEECIFGMENTGMYGAHALNYLSKNSKLVYVINPLHLKRSLGLVRGKNDRVDARRIAHFTAKNHTELISYIQSGQVIEQLRMLQSKRKQLVRTLQAISAPEKDQLQFGNKFASRFIHKTQQPVVAALREAIKMLDRKITAVIQASQELKVMRERLCSVPGIGPVLSAAFIVITNGGKRLLDPRKLACYAGIVPFDYQSGSSIYRKPRVSLMADKGFKKLLHLAALRVIQLPGELQSYYLRKVAEGKNKMLVINAIRNKIVLRACAVLRNENFYTPPLTLS